MIQAQSKKELNNESLIKGKNGELTLKIMGSWNEYQSTDQIKKFNMKGCTKMITKLNNEKANCVREKINKIRKGGVKMKDLKVLVKRCKFCNEKLQANVVRVFSTDEKSTVYYEYEKCNCKEARMFRKMQGIRKLQMEHIRRQKRRVSTSC